MPTIDRAFLQNELAGLERQQAETIQRLHQLDGAIQAVQQLIAALDKQAAQATRDGEEVSPVDLAAILPPGYTAEGDLEPHED
jgi:type II secretory pathway component PulM